MAAKLSISSVRCEHHETGLGLSVPSPRLSWVVAPKEDCFPRNWIQQSYEVQIQRHVSGSNTFCVHGDSSVLVPWPDVPLNSSEAAKVRIRSLGTCDSGECNTDWSDWKDIEASLFQKGDWTAKTISTPARTDAPHPDENGTRPWRFRKVFTASDNRARSRLYVTALGVYSVYLNGHRVGDQCLAPGWTSYQHRIQFQTFDVGPFIKTGQNVLVVEVAEGWYVGRLLWLEGIRNLYGQNLGALAQLDMFDEDGTADLSLRVQTDETWECALSPTVSSGIYDGETYDLGLEYDASDTASTKSTWQTVTVIEAPKSNFEASSAPPVRVTQTVQPVSVFQDPDGKTLVDFGQNLVGRIRIPFISRPNGHRLVIRHAEVLEHGKLGTRPLRNAKATDQIIFGGDLALKDWFPQYTYHGFRYIEVTGWSPQDSDPLTTQSLCAEVLHTDMARTGSFSCSNKNVNQLHENVVWSMRGNFVGIPTDCPQRDERLGWTGDIQVFSPTASYLYNCSGMLANWMKDVVAETKAGGGIVPLVVPNAMKDGPWPAVPQAIWDDVIILLPWTLYRNFGDLRVLRDSWDGMKEYLENIRRGDDGLWSPDLWQLGDWLDPNAPPSDPGLSRTDGVLVADEYLVHVTSVMVKIATALNLASDVERLQAEHDKLKQAFLDKYVAKSGLIVGDSQTSLALQIVFGLHHDAEQRKVAAERLVRLVKYAQFRVSTGFAGTPTILRALSLGGHDQVAYRMLLEEGCPSWLYPVLKGATTIWERWDSMLEDGSINPGEMTSFNHYALGSVAEWLHETVGGIKLLEPGWKKFLVKPSPGGDITHADTTFHSPCGTIQCSWKLVGEDVLEGTLTVPPNATAVIETPDGRLHVGSGVHGLHWNVKYSEAWPPKALLAQFREP